MIKKEQKNALIISAAVLVVVVAVILAIVLWPKSSTLSGGGLENAGDYYVLSYEASYDSSTNLLTGGAEYEIIDSTARLKSILGKLQDGKSTDFDKDFFETKNLLITRAGVDASVDSLELDEKNADIVIYHDCPLGTDTDIYTFKTFLIPVEKTVTSASVTNSCYPDRLY
jgi:hypothetical protein